MANPAAGLLPRTIPFTRLRARLAGEVLAEFLGTFMLLLLGTGRSP